MLECLINNTGCVPVVAESYGAWDLTARDFFLNLGPVWLHHWESQSQWSSMSCKGG